MIALEYEENPPKKTMNHGQAKKHVKTLGDGWRLPTKKELLHAYKTKVNGFIASGYWSSSTSGCFTNGAWVVGFSSGYTGSYYKAGNFYVRCVREKNVRI